VTFLVRGTLTKNQAKKTLQIARLVELAQEGGPVSLEVYGLVREVASEPGKEDSSRERNARRLKAELVARGFRRVAFRGDGPTMTIDLSADPRLLVLLEDLVREARALLGEDLDHIDQPYVSPTVLAADYKGSTKRDFYHVQTHGAGINRLARRHRMGNERVRRVLEREGVEVRRCGRPSIETRVSHAVQTRAIADYEAGVLSLEGVGEALGCTRWGAAKFLRRHNVEVRRRGRARGRAP
jgi:hypothetical protein